jgi:2-dehydro-3-deoxygalactonokinase
MMATSSAATPLLGIDWGTSNRRAYLLDQTGKVVRGVTDDQGILAVAGRFEESLADLLRRLQVESADIILSGMIGSRNGWHQVPYLAVDTPVMQLARALVEVPTKLAGIRCRIVPGYRYDSPYDVPDVMRGEETQVLGALALGANDGWFVLPGTHSKWVRVQDGRILEIATFMTGELFALLTEHGTLAAVMQERQPVPAAFEAGMRAAGQGGLTHLLFGCRALTVTDSMPASHAWSYLSGLLIGSELHEIRRRTAGAAVGVVQIIGSPALAEHYGNALRFFDIPARAWPPDEAYVAALGALTHIDVQRKDHVNSR